LLARFRRDGRIGKAGGSDDPLGILQILQGGLGLAAERDEVHRATFRGGLGRAIRSAEHVVHGDLVGDHISDRHTGRNANQHLGNH